MLEEGEGWVLVKTLPLHLVLKTFVGSSDQEPILTLCLAALRSRMKPGLTLLSKGCPESQS